MTTFLFLLEREEIKKGGVQNHYTIMVNYTESFILLTFILLNKLPWADSGNRTRVFSLAKRNFTIRLYPHFFFVVDTQCLDHSYIYEQLCQDILFRTITILCTILFDLFTILFELCHNHLPFTIIFHYIIYYKFIIYYKLYINIL